MIKVCLSCNQSLSALEFSKAKSKSDGLCIYCKKCVKYRLDIKKVERASKPVAPVKFCKTCKIWKMSDQFNKDICRSDGLSTKCIECRKLYWIENGDKGRNGSAQYRKSVKGRAVALFNSAKKRAKQSNLDFTMCLSRIEVSLMIGTCERSGIRFDLSKHSKYKNNPYAPSIDKIDAFKGYTDNNIKVVCTAYNFGKMQMTHAEYIEFCKNVVEFNK